MSNHFMMSTKRHYTRSRVMQLYLRFYDVYAFIYAYDLYFTRYLFLQLLFMKKKTPFFFVQKSRVVYRVLYTRVLFCISSFVLRYYIPVYRFTIPG